MTIEEHVEALMAASHCFDSQFRADARGALLEVARDQRHACAEAIIKIDRNAWSLDEARRATMGAQID